MLGSEPREPYKKGELIVWFVKNKEVPADVIKEICDKCGVKLLDFHGPERCVVGFDEEQVDQVMDKLYAFPEIIRNVSRNHYLYLC